MSNLRVQTISNAAGTGPVTLTGQVASKSYGAVDQRSVQILREGFNLSSITDTGVGSTDFNMSSAMATSTYITAYGNTRNVTFINSGNTAVPSTTTKYVGSTVENNTATDQSYLSVVVHGDLA